MYSACLFCARDLGRNDVLETFPIGRRLAYDAAKGRLWVVCPHCERWNLTPLEERWEAIEQAERRFRDTRLRVSTDNVGLARLREGLELVRIGEALRPEIAAWRYGDQFGRRRRRHLALAGAAVVGVGAFVVAGPVMGLVSFGGIGPLINLLNAANTIRGRRVMIPIPREGAASVAVPLDSVGASHLLRQPDGAWSLTVPAARPAGGHSWWRFQPAHMEREAVTLSGDAALRAVGILLPRVNRTGASRRQVSRAVALLEETRTPDQLFARAAARDGSGSHRRRMLERRSRLPVPAEASTLAELPAPLRLALEMASHEEQERRAMDGELAELERAWREAEEVAAIADDMFLPEGTGERVRRLREQAEGGAPP